MGFLGGLIIGFFAGVVMTCILLAQKELHAKVDEGYDKVAENFKQNYEIAKKMQEEKSKEAEAEETDES